MKNVYLYILFLLISGKSLGQGVDVIFLVDNSGSIQNGSGREFEDIHTSVQNLMEAFLACNSDNRVAVVQHSYYSQKDNFTLVWTIKRRIHIESAGFSNVPFTFSRQYTDAFTTGRAYTSLELLHDIMTGTTPTPPSGGSDIVTPMGQTLTRTPGNKLIICMITDGVTYVDDLFPYGSSGNAQYAGYTDFKNAFDANFVLIWGPHTNLGSGWASGYKSEGAGIASTTGSYTGSVYSYSNDPDGAGVTGRRILLLDNDLTYTNDADFLLKPALVDEIVNYVCTDSEIICHSTLSMFSPDYDVVANQQQNRQSDSVITATNKIASGGKAIYHAEDTVVLGSGFHSSNGSVFRGYILGCTDTFAGRMNMFTGIDEEMITKKEKPVQLFSLAPNPATESVSITSDKVMANITITSMQGVMLFNRDVKANSYELNISNYIKGFYVVTVTTEDGQIETQKLIKE